MQYLIFHVLEQPADYIAPIRGYSTSRQVPRTQGGQVDNMRRLVLFEELLRFRLGPEGYVRSIFSIRIRAKHT